MKLIKYFVLNLFDFYLIFIGTAIDLLKLNVLSINNLIEIISSCSTYFVNFNLFWRTSSASIIWLNFLLVCALIHYLYITV